MITWRIFKKVMAAMVVVIGLGMGSCVDNIDNSTTPSEKEQQEQQAAEAQQAKAQKFWAVVSHLVDVDDYTDDYEGMTFEPTYGVVQSTDDGTRYVYTNDAATAAERFGDLVDCDDIDENTPSYTYDDPDVGTLVYTKGSGRFLATVDVDIKQIPSLKKIVYMSGAYVNGFFQGRAYYRFGDVVKRRVVMYGGDENEVEEVDEYWICVRPSFGPEKKGDSHWVCLNVLPKKNTWHYHSNTNEKNYWLPTGLGTSEEHMQNLAELLYAIYNPQKWYDNVTNEAFDKLRMFHDFSRSRANLHNQYFWKNVQDAWRQFNITEKVMNIDSVAIRQMFTETIENPNPSLHLLYKGYSWYKSISWNCSLFEATFTAGNDNKERNMHKADYKERTENVQEFGMDCRQMGKTYGGYRRFFHNDNIYRWTVRHATGKELDEDHSYHEQEPIDGVVEVYRYYRDVNPTVNYDEYPEVTPKSVDRKDVKVGQFIARNGKIYDNCSEADQNGGAVAMVVYLGGRNRVEKGQPWNGLAIALEDFEMDNGLNYAFCNEQDERTLCTSNAARIQHVSGRRDGWAMTKKMSQHQCNAGHNHPLADEVWNTDKLAGFSEWFIPSTGQWDLAMQGMNYGPLTYTGGDDYTQIWKYTKDGEWLFKDADVEIPDFEDGDMYLTCTEQNDEYYHDDLNKTNRFIYAYSYSDNYQQITYKSVLKNNPAIKVRPFIAFEYGEGGNADPEEPWAPLQAPKLKSWIGEDGKFYKDNYDAYTNTGYTPVGYVAYYDQNASVDVNGKKYHGLAISLMSQKGFNETNWYGLADSVKKYRTRLSPEVRQQNGFSEWFVPTKDHWKKVFEQGFDCPFDENDVARVDDHVAKRSEMATFFIYSRINYYALMWTNTEVDNNKNEAYYLDFRGVKYPIKFDKADKSTKELDGWSIGLWPMMAF